MTETVCSSETLATQSSCFRKLHRDQLHS
jgi:hypothetical protein